MNYSLIVSFNGKLDYIANHEGIDQGKRIVTEAAEFLKVSVPALYTKVSRQEIPVSKPGKRLYFNKTKLKKWILTSRRKTILELRTEAAERIKIRDKHKNFI